MKISKTDPITTRVVEFAQELISIPSQGGIDSPDNILDFIDEWFTNMGLKSETLLSECGSPVGIVVKIEGDNDGPTYCLDACVDTAPFGNADDWDFSPTSGKISEGWLHGRGSSDCKIAISIFAYLALYFSKNREQLKGNLHLLFDGDEHTGGFAGIKKYAQLYPDVSGIMIGYPGAKFVKIGARGFYRVKLKVYGTSIHSGTTKPTPLNENAVVKASYIVQELTKFDLDEEPDPDFHFGPKLSITSIQGGHDFSIIPDVCEIKVDFRLTPSVNVNYAKEVVENVVRKVDSRISSKHKTTIVAEETWPAYKLSEQSKVVSALLAAANEHSEEEVLPKVSGPSNIGNYLATLGIEATCGYGVTYENLHSANERLLIVSIPRVYEIYRTALKSLLWK